MPNSSSVATPRQFQEALLRLRDKKLQSLDIPIFKAFCDAPSNTLTATQLAEVCQLGTWNESNLRFGLLAQRIGKSLNYTPTRRKNGSLRWWEAAALGSTDDDASNANYQWTLRPELVEALRSMKWV